MHTYSIQNLAYQNLTLIDIIKYILRMNLLKSKQKKTTPISGLFSLSEKTLLRIIKSLIWIHWNFLYLVLLSWTQFFFSFVYIILNSLFTGKQKKIMKVLMAQIKVFWSLQQTLTLKMFSKSKNKARNRLCFLLFTFLQITRLKPNEKTLRYENLWNYSFFIVFSPRKEKSFEIGEAHVEIEAYRKSKQRA